MFFHPRAPLFVCGIEQMIIRWAPLFVCGIEQMIIRRAPVRMNVRASCRQLMLTSPARIFL